MGRGEGADCVGYKTLGSWTITIRQMENQIHGNEFQRKSEQNI